MSLLTAGYWPTTYWVENYWEDDYWQDYGVAKKTKSQDDMSLLYQQWLFIQEYEPRIVVP